MTTFGQLMNESHQSLRDNFEVSTNQMDEAIRSAQQTPGVFGARMTGGGFGGCIVIVADSSANINKLEGAMRVKPVSGAQLTN
jgi:galactokinase